MSERIRNSLNKERIFGSRKKGFLHKYVLETQRVPSYQSNLILQWFYARSWKGKKSSCLYDGT